jgi:SAM-dependent methyltransferase
VTNSRREKPPGLDADQASVFMEESVARAYHHRPPHPPAVADLLLSLLGGAGGPVLDVGAGTGDLARALVPADTVTRVDAVDMSAPMIAEGRRAAQGDHPNLRWICARIEDADLSPPYALAVAGDSLNWTDWYVTLPRLHDALTPDGLLAIVQRTWGSGAQEERELVARHSTNREWQPYDLVPELTSRGLFRVVNYLFMAGSWQPTIQEYVESRHAQAGFSRARMGAAGSAAFDQELTELLERLVNERRLRVLGDRLHLQVVAAAAWGRPLPMPA